MKRPRRAGSLFGWLLLAGLVAAAGCMEDPVRPAVPAGRIVGRVRTGGLPVPARIVARRIADGSAETYTAQTEPDSSGLFALDVPGGRYTVELRVRSERYYGSYTGRLSGPPDTLRVEAGAWPVTMDFDLGSVTLDATLSHALDGQWAEVVLHDSRSEGEEWIETTSETASIEDGSFRVELPGVRPGEYKVEIVLPEGGEHLWLPGTHDITRSPRKTVAADAVLALSCQLNPAPAWIEGRVAGASQALGLQDATILAIVNADSTFVARVRLGSDGTFLVPIHVPEPVKLVVIQSGVEHWVGGPSFAAATVYTLRSGETTSGVEFVDYGFFIDIDCPDGVAGNVKFELYDADSLTPVVSVWTYTWMFERQAGIANLWPGRYLMRVSRSAYAPGVSWRPQWFDRATDAAHAQVIELGGAGTVVPLHMVLERGGTIAGSVRPNAGAAEPYLVFMTLASDCVVGEYDYIWEPDYAFSITGLVDGDYKVGVCPNGPWNYQDPPPGATIWYPGTSNWQDAGTITIRDAGTVTGLVIPVP